MKERYGAMKPRSFHFQANKAKWMSEEELDLLAEDVIKVAGYFYFALIGQNANANKENLKPKKKKTSALM